MGESAASIVGGTVVVGSLVGLLLGGLGGLVTGCVNSERRNRIAEEVSLALPPRVVAAPQFSEPLMTLAKASKRFHKEAFVKLAGKISAMLKVANELVSATPASVTPAMALLGAQYEASVREHLQAFYSRCSVTVTRRAEDARDGKGTRDMEPVNRDMKLAHQLLVDATMQMADMMQAVAKDKHSQALADKEHRWTSRRRGEAM
jgi:hypothetical protein